MTKHNTPLHTLGHGSCPACQQDTALRIEEIARLQARNRDLLAALKGLLAQFSGTNADHEGWARAELDQARAAIASAKETE